MQTAWRLVNRTRRWGLLYERLKQRCGAKKAIVAVARRVWCVMVACSRAARSIAWLPNDKTSFITTTNDQGRT